MKGLFAMAGLAFALTALAPVAVGADAAGDKAQIDALYQKFSTAFQHKDLTAIMSVYVPGDSLFVFDVTPPRQHVGWHDYRADWKGLLAAFKGPLAFRISDLSVTISGDVAYTHSIQHVSGTWAEGGPANLTVRVTNVLRKIGGAWLIVQEHVSVPVDVTTGKADLQSKP